MRILILINHNKASKFYCNMFNKLGYETYIPFKCDIENYVLSGEDVLKYRTISNEMDFVKELDLYDFYSKNQTNQFERIISIIENNFDILLTLHIINPLINKKFLSLQLRTYFIMWGDFDNDHYSIYHKGIIENENKYYFINHPFLIDEYIKKYNIPDHKYIYIPLGINDISKNENTYNPKNNDIVIIASRLKSIPYAKNFIESLTMNCKNIHFHIYGKSNENVYFSTNNVFIHETLVDETELYNYIKKYKLAININHHRNIIQYSSMEYACINIPNFYQRNSAIDYIIKIDNFFIYDDIKSLCQKIELYLSCESDYIDIKNKNNQILYNFYKFDQLIEQYKIFF